jgi:hypothetical protein
VSARAFAGTPSQNTWLQFLMAQGAWALTPHLGIGLEGQGKTRRGAARDYTDLAAGPFVELIPDAALSIRLSARGHRFLYYPWFDYSFAGTELGGSIRYRWTRRHALSLSGQTATRRHASPALGFIDGTGTLVEKERRRDAVLGVSAHYSYRGPVAAGFGYSFDEIVSNSFGQTQQRHRLSGSLGIRLGANFFLLTQGTLQLTRYPDGIFLSEALLLIEDDENGSMVVTRLSRPLSEHFEVDLRYAWYSSQMSHNGLTYRRQLAGLGVTWRWE